MIKTKLLDEIIQFCKLNDITDVDSFVDECVTIGFNFKKYGLKPQIEVPVIPQVEKVDTPVELNDDSRYEIKQVNIKSKREDNDDDYFNS